MSIPILTTKFYIPPLRPGLVSRPRLIERLNEGLRRTPSVTLVSAPAGFGKSTLVSEWLHQLADGTKWRSKRAGGQQFRPFRFPAHSVWLSLDQADNEPRRFWSHFMAALQQINPAVGQTAQDLLQGPQLPHLETLITMLINDIAAFAGD